MEILVPIFPTNYSKPRARNNSGCHCGKTMMKHHPENHNRKSAWLAAAKKKPVSIWDELMEFENMLTPVTLLANSLASNIEKRRKRASGGSTEKDETSTKKKLFEMKLDVNDYKPEELNVKILNGFVTIEGKHEEKESENDGFSFKQFTRKFRLPENVIEENIECKLDGGHLLVTAPLKCLEEPQTTNVRTIPITVVGADDDITAAKKLTTSEVIGEEVQTELTEDEKPQDKNETETTVNSGTKN